MGKELHKVSLRVPCIESKRNAPLGTGTPSGQFARTGPRHPLAQRPTVLVARGPWKPFRIGTTPAGSMADDSGIVTGHD